MKTTPSKQKAREAAESTFGEVIECEKIDRQIALLHC